MTKFYVAAHAVIKKDDKILVTRRSGTNDFKPGFWDLPGGKLEAGESPEQGLAREIQEETGLKVSIGNIVHVYTGFEELPDQQHFQLVYECEYESGDVVLNPEEHDECKWVTVEELKSMDTIHFVESWLSR